MGQGSVFRNQDQVKPASNWTRTREENHNQQPPTGLQMVLQTATRVDQNIFQNPQQELPEEVWYSQTLGTGRMDRRSMDPPNLT